MKLPRFSKNVSEVLYESEWVRVSFVPHEHEAKQVQVEFTRVPVPGFQCGAGDAHELGQALYHVGRQLLLERHGHNAGPMPGYDVPPDLPERQEERE